jgi:hypothetical protein
MEAINAPRKGIGRPPKFSEARRPVTITLPETTLQQLASIHADRAKAIVKLVNAAVRVGPQAHPLVETVEVAQGQSLILVGPSKALKEIRWLRLAEIAPARFLLAIPPGTAMESLEIAILDLMEKLPEKEDYERQLLTTLAKILSVARRQSQVTKAELLFVATGQPPAAKSRP